MATPASVAERAVDVGAVVKQISEDGSMNREWPSLTSLVAFAMIVLFAYTGLYALLVGQRTPCKAAFRILEPRQVELIDTYYPVDELGRIVFWPANQLDRSIRPETWTYINEQGHTPAEIRRFLNSATTTVASSGS